MKTVTIEDEDNEAMPAIAEHLRSKYNLYNAVLIKSDVKLTRIDE